MHSPEYSNLIKVNNLIIRYTSNQDINISLNLPVVLDLYYETNVAKEIHRHMADIYKAHGNTGLERDVSFWQILLHNFFISVLNSGLRKGILRYAIKRETIDVCIENPEEAIALLNKAQSYIINIVGNANRDLSKDEALDIVYKIMNLQVVEYDKKITCGLECSEKSVAENLKIMVLGTKNIPIEAHENSGRLYVLVNKYLELSKPLAFSFLVFALVVFLALCALYFVPSATFIFAFIEANAPLSFSLLALGCLCLAAVSTGLFLPAESERHMEARQTLELGRSLPCRFVGQAAETAGNDRTDLLSASRCGTAGLAESSIVDPCDTRADWQRAAGINNDTAGRDVSADTPGGGRAADPRIDDEQRADDCYEDRPQIDYATTTALTDATLGHTGRKLDFLQAAQPVGIT